MKTNYEEILRGKTDEEIEILYHRVIEEQMKQVEQDILSEAGLYSFTNNCCKFVDRIARIPVLGEAAVNINLFCSMLTASYKNEYDVSAKTKCAILGALTYLVCPVDLIPDTIPLIGMLDDISILRIVAMNLKKELDVYKKYLLSKNKAEFQEALNVVFWERYWQMQDGEADHAGAFTDREVA